jgi:hypothetical protein
MKQEKVGRKEELKTVTNERAGGSTPHNNRCGANASEECGSRARCGV